MPPVLDKLPDGRVVLYHFTSRWMLPRIMREGLKRGDVAVSMKDGFTAPWLTTDGDWSRQRWKKDSVIDKTEVRIRVVLGAGLDDPRLLTWEQIVARYKIESRWSSAMNMEPFWYARLGGVAPSEILDVEYRPGLEVLDSNKLPRNIGCLQHAGRPDKLAKAQWEKMTVPEFVQFAENWAPCSGSPGPWVDMPAHLVVGLASGQLATAPQLMLERCERLHICVDHSDYGRPAPSASRYPARQALMGLAHWLRSSRRIVTISTMSIEKLKEVLPEPRFWGIPSASTEEEAVRKGQMLHIKINPKEDVLLYLEPIPNGDGVRYCCWCKTIDNKWGLVVPHLPGNDPSDGGDTSWEERWALSEYSSLSHMLGMYLGYNTDATRINLTSILTIGINAYAAIHARPEIIVGHRQAPKPKGQEVVRGMRDLKRLVLSEDATHLLTHRYVMIDQEKARVAEEAAEKSRLHRTHGSPTLHTVRPHEFLVWVLHPLAHEKIYESEERERQIKNKEGKVIRTVKYTVFKVSRMRTGPDGGTFTRGHEVKPAKAALVVGPEDLSGAISS